MPNIPDAASYVAPMGAGLQIGLGLARQQQDRQQFMQSLAEKQRESKFTEGIQNAQAARQAKEFQDTQDWQKGFATDFQSELEKESSKNKDMGLGADVNNAFSQPTSTPQPTRTPQQIQNEVLSRWLPRAPAPVLEKLAPMMQRQMITPAQQALIEYRNGMLTEKQYRDSVLENQGQERNDLRRSAIKSGQMAQLRSLQTSTGEPIFDPETGEFDPEAYQRALKKAGTSFEFNKTMTAAERQADKIISSDKNLASLPEDKKAEVRSQIVSNGGKFPDLSKEQVKDFGLLENTLRGTEKLEEKLKGYEGDFGPIETRAKNLAGKATGAYPKERELLQEYQTLATGRAFTFGGKTLTQNEKDAILEQIGNPNDSDFRNRFKSFRVNQLEQLGEKLKEIEDLGIQNNPKIRDRYVTMKSLYDKTAKNIGVPASDAYPPGDAKNEASTYDIGGQKVTVKRVK